MAFLEALHGEHIHLGACCAPVLAIIQSGREGPQPKTQSCMAGAGDGPSSAFSARMTTPGELTWEGLGTTDCIVGATEEDDPLLLKDMVERLTWKSMSVYLEAGSRLVPEKMATEWHNPT